MHKWFADRLSLHPTLGTAVFALARSPRLVAAPSQHLTSAIKSHAAVLGLKLHSITESNEVVLQLSADADEQISEAVATLRDRLRLQ